jgi:hypothetical protein
VKIAQIYRENAACVFGVWQGSKTFWIEPIAAFDTEAEAQALVSELSDAVDALLTTRDFCGDEAEALREWQRENRKLSELERIAVREELASKWAEYRAEACR